MNETVNLHLPQFEATDRIHHDDFNDAFDKIDAGVKAAADVASFICLGKISASGQTSAHFDCSGINLSQFRRLELYFDGTPTDSSAEKVMLRINNLTSGYASFSDVGAQSYLAVADYGYLSNYIFNHAWIRIELGNIIAAESNYSRFYTGRPQIVTADRRTLSCILDLSPAAVETLDFIPMEDNKPLPPDFAVQIYGLKK